MNTPLNPSEGHANPAGAFSGPTEFADIIRRALECAAQQGWTQMVWCDADYLDWPLGERLAIDSLNAWAGSGRHLLLMAHDFDGLIRHKPRFVSWRKTWDHIVECRLCRHRDAGDMPSAIWSPHWAMRRIDATRCVGTAHLEPQRRVLLKEELDECYRQGSPSFPATTLGL